MRSAPTDLSRSFVFLAFLTYSLQCLPAAETVSLSGSIEENFCPLACGICCGTHTVTDTSGELVFAVGNSFVDLTTISGDQQNHLINGYFYESLGQCGVNECTYFTIETVDKARVAEPEYDETNNTLSIESIVVNNTDQQRYTATLSAPFNVDSVTEIDDANKIAQGGDCSASGAACADGTICVSYFGIAGEQGPEFKSCEIPCSHPGGTCPIGQSCLTIADGPGLVCVVD